MMNKRNDTFATSLTAFSGPMTPFASANRSPHGDCAIRSPNISLKIGLKGEKQSTIRSTVQRPVTAAASERRQVAEGVGEWQRKDETRNAVGRGELAGQIIYA